MTNVLNGLGVIVVHYDVVKSHAPQSMNQMPAGQSTQIPRPEVFQKRARDIFHLDQVDDCTQRTGLTDLEHNLTHPRAILLAPSQ